MKALDAWENMAEIRPVLTMLAMSPFIHSEGEARQIMEHTKESSAETVAHRKEQVIMLKAKLLVMRDQAIVSAAADALQTGKVDP